MTTHNNGTKAAVVTPPPLDFSRVEALRKHMMLTTRQFAQLLGVSRVTYNAWLKGGPIRQSNDKKVRDVLRKLLRVMTYHRWPTPEVIAMDSPQRLTTLLEVIEKSD